MQQDAQLAFASGADRWNLGHRSIVADTAQEMTQKGPWRLLCRSSREYCMPVEVIVVFVVNNLVSQRTVSLASAFVHCESDEIHIVTSVIGEQHIPAASSFLESFQSENLLNPCIIRRRVLARGQGRVTFPSFRCVVPSWEKRQVVRVIEDYIEKVGATLLVVGSENLAKESSETIGSFCVSVVKTIRDIPILVAKVNSVGKSHRQQTGEGSPRKRRFQRRFVS